jgi:hypothetical protein
MYLARILPLPPVDAGVLSALPGADLTGVLKAELLAAVLEACAEDGEESTEVLKGRGGLPDCCCCWGVEAAEDFAEPGERIIASIALLPTVVGERYKELQSRKIVPRDRSR